VGLIGREPQQQQQLLLLLLVLRLTQTATAAGLSYTKLSGEQRQAVCTTLGIGLELLQLFFAAAAGGCGWCSAGCGTPWVKRELDLLKGCEQQQQ
jgi:hypothetical protein